MKKQRKKGKNKNKKIKQPKGRNKQERKESKKRIKTERISNGCKRKKLRKDESEIIQGRKTERRNFWTPNYPETFFPVLQTQLEDYTSK
jgi:hypothetical protein